MFQRAKNRYRLIRNQIRATKAIWRDDQVLWKMHIDGTTVYIGPRAVVAYGLITRTNIVGHTDELWRK